MTIRIAGQIFELTEDREREEYIRRACKEIDETLTELKKAFPSKTISDLLALVALNLCVENYSLKDEIEKSASEDESLHRQLESYLKTI